MRKILTRTERERKGARNRVIIGLALVAIMVLGTLGYTFYWQTEEEETRINYNGVEFVLNENSLWEFKVQDFEFLTQYNPEDTENISTPIFVTVNNYAGKPLFFVGGGTGKQEIARNLWDFILRENDACIKGYEALCEDDAPMKECSEDNIVIFKEGNFTEITQEDNCIFILSSYNEQVRATDALLFKMLGIKRF